MLPFEPEELAPMQERLPAALAEATEVMKMAKRLVESGKLTDLPCPGLRRENIFDWPDGLRMTISHDRLANGVQLHVSASPTDGELMNKLLTMADAEERTKYLESDIISRFHRLSQSSAEIELVMVTQQSVMHFFGPALKVF